MEKMHEHTQRTSKRPLSDSDGGKNARPSQAGTKRLFSDRVSGLLDSSQGYDENDQPGYIADEVHEEKRSRGGDWPLRKASPINAEELRVQDDSSSSMDRSWSPVRKSHFVEGSMNDRASKMPPPEFIGEESLCEAFERNDAKSKTAQQPSSSSSTAEKSETARHSGIFRFGKSVAATFNLQNWKIWSKPSQQPDETQQQKALRERQEKAEKIYQELKKSGNFRDASIPPSFRVTDSEDTSAKHDSGIAFDTSTLPRVTTREEKRLGRVFIEPPKLPTYPDENHAPEAQYTAPVTRSSLQITTRSSTITKTYPKTTHPTRAHSQDPQSQPRTRKRSLSIPRKRKGPPTTSSSSTIQVSEPDVPAPSARHASSSPGRGPGLRHVASHKNLRKHRKLIKRVSDLEGKLAAARQQLRDAEGQPLPSQFQIQIQSQAQTPSQALTQSQKQGSLQDKMQEHTASTEEVPRIGRPRFVPGALATLPSERLLSGYVNSDGEDEGDEDAGDGGDELEKTEDVTQIGRAVSTDYGERREGFEWPDYVF